MMGVCLTVATKWVVPASVFLQGTVQAACGPLSHSLKVLVATGHLPLSWRPHQAAGIGSTCVPQRLAITHSKLPLSAASTLPAATPAGRSKDQLRPSGPQRPQLPRLPQVCEARRTGEPPEWFPAGRHPCHPLHHRAGGHLWRRPFGAPLGERQRAAQAATHRGECMGMSR